MTTDAGAGMATGERATPGSHRDDSVAVSVRGLVKRYGGRAVVDGVDLELRRGELLALLGPNGAGKTTTVEILEGYRAADGGEVRVLGLDPARDGRELRTRIGLMLQGGGGLYPAARPREVVALFARFYAAPRDPDEVLRLVGIDPATRTRIRYLSGGEKQRLALALALVGRPELAILDEPTAGMDPAAKAATRALIGELRAAGVTILLTTHELADVERLADRVAILDRGRIVASGTVDGLRGTPTLRFRPAAALDPADAHLLGAAAVDGGWYAIERVAPTPASVARLSAWAAERGLLLLELRTDGGSLEERYLELTGERGAEG